MTKIENARDNDIRICFVSPAAYPILADRDLSFVGGAEVQQVLIARALETEGLRPLFVVGDYGQPDIENYGGITSHKCPFRYFTGQKYMFAPDAAKLIAVLHRIRPHFVLFKTPVSMAFTLALHRRLFGGRLIHILAHDRDARRGRRKPADLLYDLGVPFVDVTVFQTERQRELGMKHMGLRGPVIPNIAHAAPESLAREHLKPVDGLWVGTCTPVKRPELFLDLAERLPELDFAMMIAPERDRDLNESIARRAGSLKNVDYLGFVKYADTFAHYSRARTVVNTSFEEGFPNVFLQAWQTRAPVVSLKIDPDDVVAQLGLGFSCGDDFELFVQRMVLMASDADLRHKTGARAYEHLAATHSPRAVAAKYMELFS